MSHELVIEPQASSWGAIPGVLDTPERGDVVPETFADHGPSRVIEIGK